MKSLKIFILFLLVLEMAACRNKSLKVEQPPADEVEFIAPIGKKIASNLVTSLKSELKAAMEKGGVEEAIPLCYSKALYLTDSIAQNSSFHVSIKRISNKLRNPKNKPDGQEQLALDLFEELIRNGDNIPEFYIQKITGGNTVEFNFYKPMKMESLCLICHGDKNTMAPDAARMIREYYPDDKATGYKEGDFRGLIRIKFYEPVL